MLVTAFFFLLGAVSVTYGNILNCKGTGLSFAALPELTRGATVFITIYMQCIIMQKKKLFDPAGQRYILLIDQPLFLE